MVYVCFIYLHWFSINYEALTIIKNLESLKDFERNVLLRPWMLSITATLRNALFQLCVNPEVKTQRDASQFFALHEHLVSHNNQTVEWTAYNKSHNAAQWLFVTLTAQQRSKTTGAQEYEKPPFHALFSPNSNRSDSTRKRVFPSSGMEFAMVS